MRRRSCLLGSLLVLFAAGFASSAELVGHWDLGAGDGETAEDLSGQGHEATIRFGRIQELGKTRALALDGYLTHGEIPGTRSFTLSDGLTIAAWISPNQLRRNTIICGKPNTNRAWTTPTAGLFAPEEQRIALGLWTSPKTIVTSSQPIPLEAWTFVAGTYDNNVACLYVNDQLVTEQRSGEEGR